MLPALIIRLEENHKLIIKIISLGASGDVVLLRGRGSMCPLPKFTFTGAKLSKTNVKKRKKCLLSSVSFFCIGNVMLCKGL